MDAEAQGHKTKQGSREKPSAAKSSGRKTPGSEGILPKVASEDEPRSWGDGSGYDHDAWLKEQRPPHWG
jgi:hypothetical protein